MTFREKLQKEHPEAAGEMFTGGCAFCPDYYGYETRQGCPADNRTACWDRDIPEAGEEQETECKYCHRKPKFDRGGIFFEWENEEEIADGPWTIMYAGVDDKGRMTITASGDGRAVYYPKYCPECGRKLEAEDAR